MSLDPISKPVKRSTEKRRRDAELDAHTAEVRGVVFARDNYRCRISPWCDASHVHLELVHLKAKGMGGDHGVRTTPENCIVGCCVHHRGRRSLHSGHIHYRFVDAIRGANAPMVFEYHEEIGRFDRSAGGVGR